MAGTATHIAVADKIYTILGKDAIRNLPLFFGGNIAPDAIHAKPNYQRADKKRTHLTEEISGEDFQNQEKLKTFHERINRFIKNYYFSSSEYKDLYLGYVIHLLTDELFNIIVRERFVELMKKDGINQSEREFFNRIIADIENVDHILISNYVYTQNVIDILGSVWDYEIKDYIGKTEINNSKRWVINTFFKGVSLQTEPKYYSYDEAIDFINYAVNDIIERLSGNSDIIKIL